MAIDKFDVFTKDILNLSKIHDDNEDNHGDKDIIRNYEERVADSIKRMQDKRLKSLEKFIINKTYKVLSLKSDPIIEQEIKILDKDYRNSRMRVIFKKLGLSYEVKMWVDPTKFEIISEVRPQKQQVKWYSKGKLKEDEDWVNESKEGYTNLSYELKDLIGYHELYKSSEELRIADNFIKLIQFTFNNLIDTGIFINVMAKKSKSLFSKPPKDDQNYDIQIYSYIPTLEGEVIFVGDSKSDTSPKYYTVDLVKCAENPEEYPIYIRNPKVVHSPEDPWGEEDWAID